MNGTKLSSGARRTMPGRRWVRRGLLGLALTVVAAPVPALATSSAGFAAASCGSGYGSPQTYIVYSSDTAHVRGGYAVVYYNAAKQNNCAILYNDHPGTQLTSGIAVTIKNTVTGAHSDDGWKDGQNYSYYAGPVTVHAPHQCIEVYGIIWRGLDGVRDFYLDTGKIRCS